MAASDNTMALERWEDDMELNCLDIPVELLEGMLECAPAEIISSPAGQFFVGLLCGRLLERGQIRPEFL
jgi:hypothetical protein